MLDLHQASRGMSIVRWYRPKSRGRCQICANAMAIMPGGSGNEAAKRIQAPLAALWLLSEDRPTRTISSLTLLKERCTRDDGGATSKRFRG